MRHMLVHVEDGMELPSPGGTGVRVAVDRDAEASLTVDEATDPSGIELSVEPCSFLLIVRTDRIFTAHVGDLTM